MDKEYKDIELICICGAPFTWQAGEQQFMDSLMESGKIPSVQVPKRCQKCRQERKAQREAQQ